MIEDAVSQIRALYQQAFREFGLRALWKRALWMRALWVRALWNKRRLDP